MSDCSIEAMKPKEPPKTCWNCEDFSITGWCHEYEMGRSDTAPICKHYKEAQRLHADTLEQRCQQLEQVAREMWNGYVKHYRLSAFGSADLSGIREQLEALGVNIDD